MRLAYLPLALLAALHITSAEHAPSNDHARALQVTSTGQLTPSDATLSLQDSITWTPLGSHGDIVENPAGPVTVSSISGSTSVTALVTDGPNSAYLRLDQRSDFSAGFLEGMPLMVFLNRGEVTLIFDKPISAFATYMTVGDHYTCLYREMALTSVCYAYRAQHLGATFKLPSPPMTPQVPSLAAFLSMAQLNKPQKPSQSLELRPLCR
jgi:hypothetical protein